MADLDPRQIAQSGVDPVTGSPLSKEVRKALFKGARVSSIVPSSGSALIVRPQQKLVDDQQNALIAKNTKSDNSLQQQINKLREELATLSAGLTNIGGIIQSEGIEEKNRLLQEQEQERRYSEAKIRTGAENQLEQRIQSALVAPITALQGKVENIFGRIGNALTALFFGWLASQGLKTIKAYVEKDFNLLEKIKNAVINSVNNALRGLYIIKRGFTFIIRSIVGVTRTVIGTFSKLLTAPFKLLGGGISKLLGRGGAEVAGKVAGRAGLRTALTSIPVLGALPDVGFAIADFAQGNTAAGWLGLGAAAATLTTPWTAGAGHVASMTLSGAATVASVKGQMDRDREATPTSAAPQPATPATPPKPATPATPAKPETPSLPPPAPAAATPTQPAVPAQPALLSMPAAASPAPAPEPQTPAKPEMPTVNFNVDSTNQLSFSGSPLKGESETSNTSSNSETSNSSMSSSSSPQIQSSRSEPNIGQMPEASPNVVYRRLGEPPKPPTPSPQSNGPVTDVPLIGSSDPDNFYSLYSKLQYNVVT